MNISLKHSRLVVSILIPLLTVAVYILKAHASSSPEEQIATLYGQGRFKETVAVARDMVRRRPGDPLAHIALANTLTSVNYTMANESSKQNGKRGRVRMISLHSAPAQNVEEAVGEYRKAVQLRPRRGLYRVSLAGLLSEQNKWDEAIAEYRRALVLLPKTKEAIDTGDRPGYSHWYNNYQVLSGIHGSMARALEGKKQYAAAVAEYRKCIALDNDYPYTRRELADALNKAGRRSEARAEWKRVAAQTKFAWEAKKAREALAANPPIK